MNYGLPYMGSKNTIARWVVDHLPAADVLVEPFAGGCAVTHAAILSRKWKCIIASDITDSALTFSDAIHGRWHDEKRWISREDFNALKSTDPYVRICWSFGNNQSDYMYSKEIEPWKHALHFARVFCDFGKLAEIGIYTTDASRQWVIRNKDACKSIYTKWYIREVLHSDVDTLKLQKNLTERIEKNSEELRNYLINGLKAAGLHQRVQHARRLPYHRGFAKNRIFKWSRKYRKETRAHIQQRRRAQHVRTNKAFYIDPKFSLIIF